MMKVKSILKYFLRFVILQAILATLLIFYFDNYLISNVEFKQIIYLNLVEDIQRFLPFMNIGFVTIDLFLSLMILVFLIILYSTKFYTYVNELSFSLNRNLLDEFFQIYLLWASYLFGIFYIFRFENVSRGYTFLLTFFVPIILLIFRNPEFLSSLLGRSVTNENYLTINLDENSNFRNLRIITFRKKLDDLFHENAIKNIKNEKVLITFLEIQFETSLKETCSNISKELKWISKNVNSLKKYFAKNILAKN